MKMKRFCLYKTLAFVNAHVSGNSGTREALSYLSLQPTMLSPVSAIPSPVLFCSVFCSTGPSWSTCVSTQFLGLRGNKLECSRLPCKVFS